MKDKLKYFFGMSLILTPAIGAFLLRDIPFNYQEIVLYTYLTLAMVGVGYTFLNSRSLV